MPLQAACPPQACPSLPWLLHDLEALHACRRGFFETHVTDWLADEKLTDLVRQKWLDMWTEVDSGLGSRLKAEVAGMIVSLLLTDCPSPPTCDMLSFSGTKTKTLFAGRQGHQGQD